MSEFEDSLRAATALVTSALLLTKDGALADPGVCEHRIKFGVNANLAVCGVCRQQIEGPFPYGIRVEGQA